MPDKIYKFINPEMQKICDSYSHCRECPYAFYPGNTRYKPQCRLSDPLTDEEMLDIKEDEFNGGWDF